MKKLKNGIIFYSKKIYEKFMSLDKRKRSYLIAVFVVVFGMAWAFISAGIITANFNRSQIQGKDDEQKVNVTGIIITETKDSNKYFEIYGETGNYSNDNSVATLYNVVGNFYKDNKVAMSFQSSKGTYDEKTGIITMYDHTYIVLENNTSLKADKLTWYGSDKETVAEGHIEIKKDNDMSATAEKCIIGADYESFKIIGNTQTKVFKNEKA